MVAFSRLALALASATSALAALPILQVKGSNFVDSVTNQRFAIVGIDYQPGGSSGAGTGNGDPLSNADACLRDAVLMQRLGVNTIRIYNIDPTLNHDACASIFDAAGIYFILDVNSPLSGQYIDRSAPANTYNVDYLKHVFTVVEAFKNYNNLLGFFAGNEIINDEKTAQGNPQYIRAVQRDLKDYISKNAPRAIPVGYSAADVRDILTDQYNYLSCDNGDTSKTDFFGLNSYSWCGDGTYTKAGYDVLVSLFAGTTIPVFFSEYGCNLPRPRNFNEVLALYGPQMTTLGGGLIYEYSEEGNDYGLVTINGNGSVNIGPDFMNLLGQYNKIDVSLLQAANSTSENQKPPKCAKSLITNSIFDANFTIPARPAAAQALINNKVANAPTGKLVSVTATSVTQQVFATNGVPIPNLVLKFVNGSNTPSGTDLGAQVSNAGGSGGSGSTSSSKAAAPTNFIAAGGIAAGLLGAAVAVL